MAIIVQDSYDVTTHAARCDAKAEAHEARIIELEHQVSVLEDKLRKLGITVAKLGDAIGDFNTHVEGDWHLNE